MSSIVTYRHRRKRSAKLPAATPLLALTIA
jgi:hypothetical protein